jgi:hypothetical protein
MIRAVLAHLAPNHSVTFVLDAAQRVYPHSFTWREVGLDIRPGGRDVFDASDESPQHAADRGSRATEQHDPVRSAFSQIAAPLLQAAVILEPPPPPSNSKRPLSRTAARVQIHQRRRAGLRRPRDDRIPQEQSSLRHLSGRSQRRRNDYGDAPGSHSCRRIMAARPREDRRSGQRWAARACERRMRLPAGNRRVSDRAPTATFLHSGPCRQ